MSGPGNLINIQKVWSVKLKVRNDILEPPALNQKLWYWSLVSDQTFRILSRVGPNQQALLNQILMLFLLFGDTVLVVRSPRQFPLDFVSMLSLNFCPNLDKENASAKQQWVNPRGALDQKNIPNNIKNWSQCSNCSLLLRYFWQTKHFKILSFYRREFLMTHILIQLQLENFHYCHIIVSAIIERKSWTYLGFIQSSESF